MAIEYKAAKIKTEPIFLKLSDKEDTKRMVQTFEYLPYIYIKKINDTALSPPIDGTTINANDITYVKLYNNKFLPEIELLCKDSKGILFNDLYPFDHDTLICLFVKSTSEITNRIRMDFRVTEYETIQSCESCEYRYLIKGVINVDELHYTKFETYDETSYDLLKKLADNFKLGWATNVTSSNDKMKWINPGGTYLNFIKDVTKHAFIDKDSFIWTFIDFYHNLNYINIQKELDEFNTDEKGTLTDKKFDKDGEERNVKQYLTNNTGFEMTNKYIKKFSLVNQSFKVNLEKNYKTVARWYDTDKVTVYREELKILENKDSNLKNYEGKLRQLNDEDSDIFDNNLGSTFLGKIDKDNVHENYALAELLNEHNLDKISKMKMVVTLAQINFSIKRFQNIKVEIYNIEDLMSRKSDKKTLQNINTRLSGYWYVTGINYLYKSSGGQEQEITLIRRDLNLNYGKDTSKVNDLRNATK